MTNTGRHCGSCTLCCKLLGIDALRKPGRQWCPHCKAGTGCTVYDERPEECRTFNCAYLAEGGPLGEHWFPARSKMIVCSDPRIPRLEVHVDDARVDAWRKDPYYGELKAWSHAAQKDNGQVIVVLPDRTIVILPHEDVDLGRLEADDRILVTERITASGPVPGVEKIKADDPRLKGSVHV